jgi:hypothetical protein
MKWHGIKLNGLPLGFSCRSNDGSEFCNEVSYSLELESDNVWLVTNKALAIAAMENSTAWYNSGYNSPMNPYLGKNLELFEVEI